jgi:hypothetical protein
VTCPDALRDDGQPAPASVVVAVGRAAVDLAVRVGRSVGYLEARDRGRLRLAFERALVRLGVERWIYAPYRGAVRVADSVVPLADTAELCFVVGDGDEVRFFERIRHPATWSEHVRRQTEKKLQKTAARPTPQWMKPST